MTGTETQLRVVNNEDERRYEGWLGDRRVGLVLYDVAPGQITFVHTEVEPDLQRRGMGSRLVAGALDDARARGLRVTPACSFVAAYINRHPSTPARTMTPDDDSGDEPEGRQTPPVSQPLRPSSSRATGPG